MPEKVVIGGATLWHADCLEVLPGLPKHDLLCTDPPYGIGAGAEAFKNGTKKGDAAYTFGAWDSEPPKRWLLDMMLDHASSAIVWGGNYFGLPASRCWLVWDKCTGDNSYADAELAWTNIDATVRVLKHPWVGANAKERGEERLHPTQKPLRVMGWSLERVAGARTVLDPFMGSGTTGVACMQLGREFTGIERERRYFDIACERIQRAHDQGVLLPPETAGTPQQTGLALEP